MSIINANPCRQKGPTIYVLQTLSDLSWIKQPNDGDIAIIVVSGAATFWVFQSVFAGETNDYSAIAGGCQGAWVNGGSVINPVIFGADPSGETDSTEAIQEAIDSLGGNPGLILFPDGFFRISGDPAITLHNGQYLVGTANRLAYNLDPPSTVGTLLMYTGTGTAILCDGECTVLKDFVIASENALTGRGVMLQNAGGFFVLEYVFFYRFEIGLELHETINGSVTKCAFRDCDLGMTTSGSYNNIVVFKECSYFTNRVGAYINAASDIHWTDCTFELNTEHGLWFAGGGGSCRIEGNNWFEANGGTTGTGIFCDYSLLDGVVIERNWFQNHFNAIRHTNGQGNIIQKNYFPTNTLVAPGKCEITVGAGSYHTRISENYFRFDHNESTSIADSGNFTTRFNNFIGDTAQQTANDGMKTYGFIRHLRPASIPSGTEKGIAGIHPTDSNSGLSLGGFSASPFATWLQSLDQRSGNSTVYPLILNPVGGNVGVHGTDPVSAFTVVPSPGGDVNRLGLAAFFNPDAVSDGIFTTNWIGKAAIAGQAAEWGCQSYPATPANCLAFFGCYGDNQVTEMINVAKGGYVGIGVAGTSSQRLHVSGSTRLQGDVQMEDNVRIFPLPPIFANNAAALGGGLIPGDIYRTGADPDLICITHP